VPPGCTAEQATGTCRAPTVVAAVAPPVARQPAAPCGHRSLTTFDPHARCCPSIIAASCAEGWFPHSPPGQPSGPTQAWAGTATCRARAAQSAPVGRACLLSGTAPRPPWSRQLGAATHYACRSAGLPSPPGTGTPPSTSTTRRCVAVVASCAQQLMRAATYLGTEHQTIAVCGVCCAWFAQWAREALLAAMRYAQAAAPENDMQQGLHYARFLAR
jgi:hypothetical protein